MLPGGVRLCEAKFFNISARNEASVSYHFKQKIELPTIWQHKSWVFIEEEISVLFFALKFIY